MSDPENLHVRFDLPAAVETASKKQKEEPSFAVDHVTTTNTEDEVLFEKDGAIWKRRAKTHVGRSQEHYLGLPKTLKPPDCSPNPKKAHLSEPIAAVNENGNTKRKAAEPSQDDLTLNSPVELQTSRSDPVSQQLPVAVLESIQSHLDEIGSILKRQGPRTESIPDHPSMKFWDGLKRAGTSQDLFNCSRGEYPALWYKFKRFETLSLLNLYHYQHELIELESRIYRPDYRELPGTMDGTMVAEMRCLLRDYYKAVKSFREISRMERPSLEERKATAETLAAKLETEHYKSAADAYGMMDLTPQALGVEADAIRVMTRAMTMSFSGNETAFRRSATLAAASHGTVKGSAQSRWTNLCRIKFWSNKDEESGLGHDESVDASGRVFQDRKPGEAKSGIQIQFAGRPYHLPISRGVDTAARVIVSIIAGIFLLAPTFALSYINNKTYRLVTTSLFPILFAISLSLMSPAKNQELMAATAAYTAVLVVFLSQTN